VIFPLLANVSFAQTPTGNFIGALDNGATNILSSLRLQVDIPCSGHASLISGELKTIDGVTGVQFSLPNIFDVKYDPSKTSKQQILALEVFKTYKATVLSEESNQVLALDNQPTQNQQTPSGSCGSGGSCGCGCGGR
jgi:copper chaperone CopZ